MYFGLNSEQRAFQDQLDIVLRQACPIDALLAAGDGEDAVSAFSGVLAPLGLTAVLVPEAYGGLGLGVLDGAILAEVLGRHAVPSTYFETSVAIAALIHGGDARQRASWLPALAEGRARATIAWGEAGERWAPEQWTLPCEAGRVSGRKRFVPSAAAADLIVVGLSGRRLGLVRPADGGVEVTPIRSLDRTRPLYDVAFDRAKVELLEGADQAAGRTFDTALVLLAADSYGGGMSCLHRTRDYLGDRVQFGMPLGRFQGIKHQLADMATALQPAIGLYWYAAHLLDQGDARAPAYAAIAKAELSDLYAGVSRQSVELHGGIGYTWEYGLHLWLKRALFNRNMAGSIRASRLRAADLLGW